MERGGHAPKVSVVMPTYNEGTRLAAAVASVLNQSFSELELLIVDDASSEAIGEGVSAFKGDPRCRLIRRAENMGAAAARNTGISATSDKFIAFLDSDDVWYPQKLERQLAWMKSQRQAVACTGYRIVTPFHTTGEVRLSDRVGLQDLLSGCGVSPGSTMIVERALFEKIGPFDESLRRLEDWEWLLRCAQVTPIAVVPEVLALVNNGPREKHSMESVRDSAENIERHAIAGRYGLNEKEIKLLRSTLHGEVAAAAFRHKRYTSALFSLLRSLSYHPFKRASYFHRIALALKGDVLARLSRTERR